MRTDGQTIRAHEMATPHLDLQAAKAWAKKTFSKERIAEAGVVAATIVLAGYVGGVLIQGIQTYSIAGF